MHCIVHMYKNHRNFAPTPLLFGIDDAEEIAAPNLMRLETANEYVDFTFWHRPGEEGRKEVRWGRTSYDPPAVTFFFLTVEGGGRGRKEVHRDWFWQL